MEELILNERKLKENLVQAVNDSKLPAFIIKPILKELLGQVNILEQQQYEQAMKSKEATQKDDKSDKTEAKNGQD